MTEQKIPTPPTANQSKNLALLRENFGLSDDELKRCLFLRADSDEPWIPPDITIAIARQTGQIRHITPSFVEYVSELKQYVYSATAVDLRDFTFTRVGVATAGEKPNGIEIEPNLLAEGRALNAALNAAGVNPFRAGTVATIARRSGDMQFTGMPSDEQKQFYKTSDETIARTRDLKAIHAIAERKGLILNLPSGGNSSAKYRTWLHENFGTYTAATLEPEARARVINALENYGTDYFADVPADLQNDAMIA